MSNILAIETATEACSAALLNKEGDKVNVYERFQLAPREHTKLVLPMLDEVLTEAGVTLQDIDVVAFGRGPGAFTGLRIAAGIAQGVALSIDKPVIPVSTLAALALQVGLNDYQDEIIIAALDARMEEVYWGQFVLVNEMVEPLTEERVSSAEIMLASISNSACTGVGSAWDVYKDQLFSKEGVYSQPKNINILSAAYPQAADIARLALPLLEAGKTTAVEDAQPIYIRNKVAEKQHNK